ncbi:MAG: riboflavin biosynthesis protein RibF [Deltaproteobacteria bacterium]|jgi:riboflavin kinase/FMN adenylyltransferase|nr:riboflavin biosynthesis protein RibF [Deltaproteobacteria bacterium]
MKILSDWQNAPPLTEPRVVMTMGTFDGLHLGHQFLVREVMRKAREKDAASLLLTFEPHPLAVLSPSSAPLALTTFEQKSRVLSGLGIDVLGCARFTEELSAIPARAFIDEVILPKANITDIFIGPDFRFGRNAEGHAGLLKEWAGSRGVRCEEVPVQTALSGETLSSSRVRGLIKVGLVESAAKLLGRNYVIEGKVVTGARRGGKMGFPTANLGEIKQLIPGPGVYAANALLRGKSRPAMTSIGNNPTFKNQYLSVETYVLDFKDDFYGEDMGLEFAARIRDMIRFDSPEALVERLKKDESEARGVLIGA